MTDVSVLIEEVVSVPASGPSKVMVLNMPVELRDHVVLAFSEWHEMSFPSLKTPSTELIHRARYTGFNAIAFWCPIPNFDFTPFLESGIDVFRIGVGGVYDIRTSASGEAEAVLPVSFFLEKVTAAEQLSTCQYPVAGDPELVRSYTRKDAGQDAPEGTVLPCAMAGRNAPAPAPADLAHITPDTVLVCPLPPLAFPNAKLDRVAELRMLLRRAQSVGCGPVVLVANTPEAVDGGISYADRFSSYFTKAITAPFHLEHARKAGAVVTSCPTVALISRAAGCKTIYTGGDALLANVASAEQAAGLLARLNAVALDIGTKTPIGYAQLAEGPAAAPEPGEPEPAPQPAEQAYVKAPPFQHQPPKPGTEKPILKPDAWFLKEQDDLPDGDFIGYIPWIPEHSEALVKIIGKRTGFGITPLRIIKDERVDAQRKAAMVTAAENPGLLRNLIFSRLTRVRSQIKAMVFTFDWHPFMRIVSRVCLDLGIPRILVPHESVFAKRSMYYVDSATGIDRPYVDLILAWGDLQREVFAERGYPADRIRTVGAPKFDAYRDGSKPQLSRAQFCRVFDLNPARPIVLFAAQPLDSQYDIEVARQAQQRAMSDLIDLTVENGWQLLIRTPPSRVHDVVGKELAKRLDEIDNVRIDHSEAYRVTASEAVHHADAVVSINSTMLFEALLLGKPAISTKYVDFESFWKHTSIQIATDKAALHACLRTSLTDPASIPVDMTWANEKLASGSFDGQASARVAAVLEGVLKGTETIEPYHVDEQISINPDHRAGNVALASLGALKTTQQYLPTLLNADNTGMVRYPIEAHAYDHYVRWGAADSKNKIRADRAFRAVGISPLFLEDGFIRSLGLGLWGDPGLSVILDDVCPYYDATRNSRLQLLLNSDLKLSKEEVDRAEKLIAFITRHKVSKYNHAPVRDLSSLRKLRKTILLVDQRYGDQSVASGLASDETFTKMMFSAYEMADKANILLKIHPDAISGGKGSYLAAPEFRFMRRHPNITAIDFDVNPYSLIGIADEVWVATSGMGFEALMANKRVRCWGAPFYAGRGLTTDEVPLPERTRKRSLAEVFHVAYLMLSRYVDPRTGKRCRLEDTLEYLVENAFGVDA